MEYANRMRRKLTEALAPEALDVLDESGKHAGHAGARPEGETHFQITIVSAAFQGKSRLQRQRSVYALLADEMNERVHALALITLTPEEAAAGQV